MDMCYLAKSNGYFEGRRNSELFMGVGYLWEISLRG